MKYMKMYMIASIFQGETLRGFRILDFDTKNIIDVTENQVFQVIKSGVKIINLEIKKGKLQGSNGDIKRYTKLLNGKPIGSTPIIILNQLGNIGYTVADYNGNIRKLSTKDTLMCSNQFGISNGKVTVRDQTEFISAISGSYELIPTETKNDETKTQSENTQDIRRDTTKASENEIKKENKTESVKVDTNNNKEQKEDVKLSFSPEQMHVLKIYYSNFNIDKNTAEQELRVLDSYIEQKQICQAGTPLLNAFIAKLETSFGLTKAFGGKLSEVIKLMLVTGIPFPESLVKLCCNTAANNLENFYKAVFPEFIDTIASIFSSDTDSFAVAARVYLKIAINEANGIYRAYDTEELKRNKEFCKEYGLCSKYTFDEIRALIGALDIMWEWGIVIKNEIPVGIFDKYLEKILRMALKYNTEEDLSMYGTPSISEKQVILCCTTLDKEFNSKTTDNTTFNQIASKLWEIPPKYKELGIFDYISTPTKEILGISEFQKFDIIDLYTLLLRVFSNIGESLCIGRFKDFCMNQMKLAEQIANKKREAVNAVNSDTNTNNSTNYVNRNVDDTVAVPKLQNINTGSNLSILNDIMSGADLTKYDSVELYRVLKTKSKNSYNETCVLIADDMLARDMIYKDMSSKQRYRLNEAIDLMLQREFNRRKEGNNKASENKYRGNSEKKGENPENKTYILKDHPDIRSKVNKLIEKANSVEMTCILEKEPNVLNICYSILRYNRASDKQLKHIDNAIRLLDE